MYSIRIFLDLKIYQIEPTYENKIKASDWIICRLG